MEYLQLVWNYDGVKLIVCHTVINLVFGLAAALHAGQFDLDKVLDFLTKKLIPYVIGYYVVKLIGDNAGLGGLALPLLAIIEANLSADLLGSLKMLGVPLPKFLTDFSR